MNSAVFTTTGGRYTPSKLRLTEEQAADRAKELNREAERMGLKTRYEVRPNITTPGHG